MTMVRRFPAMVFKFSFCRSKGMVTGFFAPLPFGYFPIREFRYFIKTSAAKVRTYCCAIICGYCDY